MLLTCVRSVAGPDKGPGAAEVPDGTRQAPRSLAVAAPGISGKVPDVAPLLCFFCFCFFGGSERLEFVLIFPGGNLGGRGSRHFPER